MLLSPSDFFGGLRKGLKAGLPPGLRTFRSARGRGRLMKVHFGEPAFHFEAWHHTGAGRIEVGLHFEASADENQAAFAYFRSRMVEVKASLPRAELERAVGGPVGESWIHPGLRVRVTGVFFFDFPHGQSGHARNYAELHPVTAFRVLTG